MHHPRQSLALLHCSIWPAPPAGAHPWPGAQARLNPKNSSLVTLPPPPLGTPILSRLSAWAPVGHRWPPNSRRPSSAYCGALYFGRRSRVGDSAHVSESPSVSARLPLRCRGHTSRGGRTLCDKIAAARPSVQRKDASNVDNRTNRLPGCWAPP